MASSILVCGAGPALGAAVARRYAQQGWDVVLVARRPEPLESLAEHLRRDGTSAYAVAADLSDTARVPELAEQVGAAVGNVDAVYYGAAANAFIPALELTPQRAQELMPLGGSTRRWRWSRLSCRA